MRILIKKIIVISAATLLALVVGPSAFAKDKDVDTGATVHSKVELKFKGDDESGADDHFNQDQKFELDGEITSIIGNNFVVSGQAIFIDTSEVDDFRQKGILSLGQRVKVKGIIKNGVKFAQNINVIGTGQGRFQFKTGDKEEGIGTSVDSNLEVKVKAQGAVQEVSAFLQQILNFIKNLA